MPDESRRVEMLALGRSCALGSSPACGRAAALRQPDRRHAGAGRGRQEGRQGRLLHLGRRRGRREDRRKAFGRSIPASKSRSSAPAPSASSSASARNTAATSTTPTSSNTSDAAHFLFWKRQGWLAPLRAGGRRRSIAGRERAIRTGYYAAWRATLSPIAYNTKLREARGRAEELRRSARSEMEGQASSRRIPATAARS